MEVNGESKIMLQRIYSSIRSENKKGCIIRVSPEEAMINIVVNNVKEPSLMTGNRHSR
jgi:hypothetical protein